MIYIFTTVILIAFICLMVICIKILNTNKALKLHVSVLNKDHNDISKENNDFRELIDIQSAMMAEAMGVSIEKLN